MKDSPPPPAEDGPRRHGEALLALLEDSWAIIRQHGAADDVSPVVPGLFVGNAHASRNKGLLLELGVCMIVACTPVMETATSFPGERVLLRGGDVDVSLPSPCRGLA